jgi:hypothetical protein
MLSHKLSKEQILDIQNARKSSNETLGFTTNPPPKGPVNPFKRAQQYIRKVKNKTYRELLHRILKGFEKDPGGFENLPENWWDIRSKLIDGTFELCADLGCCNIAECGPPMQIPECDTATQICKLDEIIPRTDIGFLDSSIRVNPEKIISAIQLPAIVLNQGTIQGEASYKKIVSTNNVCDAGCDFGTSWDCNDTNIPEGWTFYQSDDEGVSCGISKFVIVDTGILSNDYCESINEFGIPFSVVFPETTSIDATGIIPSGQIRCPGSYWIT